MVAVIVTVIVFASCRTFSVSALVVAAVVAVLGLGTSYCYSSSSFVVAIVVAAAAVVVLGVVVATVVFLLFLLLLLL